MNNVDTFVKNAKKYIELGELGYFHHDYDDLIHYAENGKDPCKKCEKNGRCGLRTCLPFYINFSRRWQNIRRQAGIEK